MKKCSSCKLVKSLSEFNKNGAKKDGLHIYCRKCHNKKSTIYRNSYPEKVKLTYQNWQKKYPERANANTVKWQRANRNKTRASLQRWRNNNRSKSAKQKARRKNREHGIAFTVTINSDVCGICFEPLTNFVYPDPLSTSLGHEPPLSVAIEEGWTIITERPEHLVCNLRKGARLDCELEGVVNIESVYRQQRKVSAYRIV